MLPSIFCQLEENEKAFVIAAIDLKIEDEKKREEEINRNMRK